MTTDMEKAAAGRLEEYRQIRTELNGYLIGGHFNRNFAFLISIGVISAKAALPVPQITFLLAAFLVAFLWRSDIDKLRAIFRVGTYIELFIEPKVEGLGWETLVGRNQKASVSLWRPIWGRGDFILLYSLHTGISVAEVWARGPLFVAGLLLLLLPIFGHLMYESHAVWAGGRERERQKWLEAQRMTDTDICR